MTVFCSLSPRCATGRAISQSRSAMDGASADLENAFDLDRGVSRQHGDADRRSRVPALVAERRDHEVGGAVHLIGTVEKGGIGIDDAAQANYRHDCVAIA